MENTNLNKSETKDMIIKAAKVAIFCGIGFWAAGPVGAVIGLIVAMTKI